MLDTTGVLLLARAMELVVSAGAMLGVRVVSEAFHFGAPGGAIAGEAASIALLGKRCGLETRESAALVAGRKWLVMRAHAPYLALGAWLGFDVLSRLGRAVHVPSLPWWVLGSGAVPLALSIAARAAMPLLRAECVTRLTKARHITAMSSAVFFMAWLVEAAETAIILRIVGIPLSMASVLAIETGLSLARSAVAFAPGGLGVQDLGYATALGMLGVPHESAAAFVLLKRAKEIAWIAFGFLLFVIGRRSRSDATPRHPDHLEAPPSRAPGQPAAA